MTRPSVAHGGFLVPNAGTVSEPLLSEPDRIDFNTLANARWGVLSGCQVTGLGQNNINVAPGSAMVNGKFVYVAGSTDLQVSIPTGLAKFDLIAINDSGVPLVIPGKESNDPYFPDPAPNQTVLAAVFCRTGLSLSDYVIDKRKFLAPALMTQTPGGEDLIRNFKAPGPSPGDPLQDYYRVRGDGHTTWSNDTVVERTAERTLSVRDNLTVKATLSTQTLAGESAVLTGDLTARNLRRGGTLPANPNVGDFWQNTDTGAAYVCNPALQGGLEWDEIATLGNMLPPGTVIMSMESPARMINKGWLPFNGYEATELLYPAIFTVASLAPYISGIPPGRVMTLPDLTSRILMPAFSVSTIGLAGPLQGGKLRENNRVKLTDGNIPEHHHHVNATPETITPKGTIQSGTGGHKHVFPDHSHLNTDPLHDHEIGLATVPVTVTPGAGANQVLTPPYAGQTKSKTAKSPASITVGKVSGTYSIDGGPHSHPVEGAPVSHDHDMEQAVFGNDPPDDLDLTPNYFTCYVYLRT